MWECLIHETPRSLLGRIGPNVRSPHSSVCANACNRRIGDSAADRPDLSTPQLQSDVARQEGLFRNAGAKLGLTPAEYAQFQMRIASRQLTYVTIPRHLDAMSWSSGGVVYVIHDVVIPQQTKGWEIDLQEGNRQLALFIPARCGNLSLIRRSLPRLARTTPRRVLPVAVAPEATAPPAPPPVTAPASPAVIVPEAPAAAPASGYQTVATSTPVTHHPRLWPLLLLPLLGLISGGHGGNVSTAPAPVIGGGPVPGCPAPVKP